MNSVFTASYISSIKKFSYGLTFGVSMFIIGSCQSQTLEMSSNQTAGQTNLSEHSYQAQAGFAGAFLAARHAQRLNDPAAASQFFSEALYQGGGNAKVLKYGFINHYQNGNLDRALELAREIERLNIDFALAAEPAIADAVNRQDWQALIALSYKIDTRMENHFLANGLRSLAYIGIGEPETALRIFYKLEDLADLSQEEERVKLLFFGSYLFELLGKKEEARAYYQQLILYKEYEHIRLQAGAGLWRLGDIAGAKEAWMHQLSGYFVPTRLIAQMDAKTSPYAKNPTLKYVIARLLLESSRLAQNNYSRQLMVARAHLARSIWPDYDDAHIILAEWAITDSDYKRAQEQLQRVPETSAIYLRKRLFQLSIAEQTYQIDAMLQSLEAEFAKADDAKADQIGREEYGILAQTSGDILRRNYQCERAIDYYQRAFSYGMSSASLYRNIGICFEQTGQSKKAEKNLLTSISLNPEDSIALNYLGYWWADEGRKLDKAITLIQKAVNLNPNSGYYADSLGWLYYRQGAFEKAVLWLEKAIQLAPSDPTISDHLGDVYWQLGRLNEARFKWQHALDLGMDEDEAAKIANKVKNGL